MGEGGGWEKWVGENEGLCGCCVVHGGIVVWWYGGGL